MSARPLDRTAHPGRLVERIVRRELRRCAARYARGTLLDIGCGDRNKEPLFRDHIREYIGLDHADSPHGLDSVDLVASAYDVPRPAESVDTVVSTAVLEHLEEPGRALREAYRVLRSGGHAIYTAPLFWHLHEEPRDFLRYTRHGLRHLFTAAGFRIVELKALSGFWTTFGTELGYYLQHFRRGPAAWLVDGAVLALHTAAAALDRLLPRDERFTWMYLVVAAKPDSPGDPGHEAGGRAHG